jgi:hypothetical protein
VQLFRHTNFNPHVTGSFEGFYGVEVIEIKVAYVSWKNRLPNEPFEALPISRTGKGMLFLTSNSLPNAKSKLL